MYTTITRRRMAPIPRILIVEDDEIIAHLISVMLEKKGYSIVGKVTSGEESIIRAAELEPDLILMDINLAGIMDGVAAAGFLFQLFHLPVVFLTALCDDQLLERAKNAEPLGYIIKPFTDRDLSSNVELALHTHAMRKKYLKKFPVDEPGKILASPDPLLITDTKGKIIIYNPSLLRFLELTADQVQMHHWHEVMMIINDQTNEEVENPVPEVIRQMLAVTYETNTSVVTKSGKGGKAGITFSPVRDDQQDLIGVSIHIREKSPDPARTAKK